LREPPQPGDDDVVLERQALHARRIEFTHPLSGQRITLESPIPADIQGVIDILQSTVK
jgi:23S rRNA pseudouridine1911/1915/1917 synthase